MKREKIVFWAWLVILVGATVALYIYFGTAEGAPLSPTLIAGASGEQQYQTPQSPEEFVPLAQAFIKKRTEAKANKDAGGGGGSGGGGSVDYDIPLPPGTEGKFAPIVTLLPAWYGLDTSDQPYVPESNTEPTITAVNLQDYETVRMYRAWLVEDQNADAVDIRFAIFMVNRIVNAPITGQENRMLDFNELSNPTLYYIIVDEDGKLKRQVPVRGMVREGVIRFGFRTMDIPKLYLRAGDKLLLVLEFSLKSTKNNYDGRAYRTIAPALDLLDPSALRIMEYNVRGSFNEFGWQDRSPALPSDMRANAVVGKPQKNQFFLLNPYGTAVFDIVRRCEGIFPGNTGKLIAHMPIRAQGKGGIWQIAEREWAPVEIPETPVPEAPDSTQNKDVIPYSFLTDLKLVIGTIGFQGIRIQKEEGVVWLFDMSESSWDGNWPVEKQIDVYASLAPDANSESYTELLFESITIGWGYPVAFPRGFSFGRMSWHNSLWETGWGAINVFSITLPHKIRTDDGGKG